MPIIKLASLIMSTISLEFPVTKVLERVGFFGNQLSSKVDLKLTPACPSWSGRLPLAESLGLSS